MKPFYRKQTLVHAEQWQPGTPIEGVKETQPAPADGDESVHEAVIQTSFGSCTITPGTWVIKNEDDEFYPCTPEEFPKRFTDANTTARLEYCLTYGNEMEELAKEAGGIPFTVLAFTLKGPLPWEKIAAVIQVIADKKPNQVLIHGFMPMEEVVAKGLPTNVTETLNTLFPAQYCFYVPGKGVERQAMAKAAKLFDADVYVIGAEIGGVHEEVCLYESWGITKIHRISVEDVEAGTEEKATDLQPAADEENEPVQENSALLQDFDDETTKRLNILAELADIASDDLVSVNVAEPLTVGTGLFNLVIAKGGGGPVIKKGDLVVSDIGIYPIEDIFDDVIAPDEKQVLVIRNNFDDVGDQIQVGLVDIWPMPASEGVIKLIQDAKEEVLETFNKLQLSNLIGVAGTNKTAADIPVGPGPEAEENNGQTPVQ